MHPKLTAETGGVICLSIIRMESGKVFVLISTFSEEMKQLLSSEHCLFELIMRSVLSAILNLQQKLRY
jgi:hypothetical protein